MQHVKALSKEDTIVQQLGGEWFIFKRASQLKITPRGPGSNFQLGSYWCRNYKFKTSVPYLIVVFSQSSTHNILTWFNQIVNIW